MQVLEWSDSALQSELRWGMCKGPKSPVTNSTRVALITRDSNKVTDAGNQTQFKIEMATLFRLASGEGQMVFDTLEEAKERAMMITSTVFFCLHHAANIKREAIKVPENAG